MNRILTNRLASHAGTRAAELTVKSDRAADRANAVITAAFNELLHGLQSGPHNYANNLEHAQKTIYRLGKLIFNSLGDSLIKLQWWAHEQATDALMATLPKGYLRAAALNLTESRVRVQEQGPGLLQFGFGQSPGGIPLFQVDDLRLTPSQEERAWRDLLFPPPSMTDIEAILRRVLPPGTTQGTFAWAGEPIPPPTLAQEFARRASEGESTQSIGRALRPWFDGEANRAERTARTLGAYVGSERNFRTSEALGNLVMAYQVHSAGGENARHTHALRSGTVYYREPAAGQWGMDVMPHPPIDTGRGPHDETAPVVNGQVTCWNCRCWLSPVLRPLPAMTRPAFTDNAAKLIPDPAHFSDWFAKADEQQRRAAAGVKRLGVAEELLGRAPTWADMVDPSTGQLLTIPELQRETAQERAARRAEALELIAKNRAAIARVAGFGTV